MFLLRHIPNALTCGNLLCGCLGLISIYKGYGTPAAYFIWAAGLFDFFDGFAARLFKVSSPIGKELDSLADMVSFGMLPAFAMFQLIDNATAVEWMPFVALLLAVFSALRLAKFNIDTRQSDSFIGVPTPANAFFITALPFVPDGFNGFLLNPWALIAITLIFCFLMVSPFELLALKFKNFKWAGNQLRFIFVALSLLLVVWWGAAALVPIILIYIVLSLTSRAWTSTQTK
jgi:CDP-diacylglycerol---serine O-phosphatidyltransferase